jgi:hypothetical protein
MYETLAVGRVPVIISDDWVAPLGPDWDSFTIRWPENRTDGLVEMLTERDREWAAMSANARGAYERYFAPGSSIDYIMDGCQALRTAGTVAETARRS